MHWLPFENRCIYHTAVLVYKSKAHIIPKYIEELLHFAFNKQYELISSTKGDLKPIACRTNYMKNSFSYSSKTVWNKITLHIRNLPTIYKFKKTTKEILILIVNNIFMPFALFYYKYMHCFLH